jgi:ADP-ribose pyrophosphatase
MITPSQLVPYTQEDFEVVNRKVVHEGIFRYVKYELRHRLFNGGWTPVLDREVVERTSAAGILPYDPILDRVVLISQFRVGAISHPAASPWLLEIVAGVLGKAERPDEVAVREAQEEAGCRVLELYPINDYFVSPGGSNEYLHLYCGRIDASGIDGKHGLDEENEDILAFTLPADEAFELLRQGKIKTAPALVALQWLQINRNFLRDFWLKKI